MPWIEIIWTGENTRHIAEHGVTAAEVEQVMTNPSGGGVSRSSGRPVAFGYTAAGRRLAVVYEAIDDITIYPITAYEVE